jgi:integrase
MAICIWLSADALSTLTATQPVPNGEQIIMNDKRKLDPNPGPSNEAIAPLRRHDRNRHVLRSDAKDERPGRPSAAARPPRSVTQSAVRQPKSNQSPITVSRAASAPEPTAKRGNILAFELVPTTVASSEVQSGTPGAIALPAYNYGSAATQPDADPSPLVILQTTSERCIASGDSSSLAALSFREAARRWIESRDSVLRERTGESYKHHISQLNKFFGDLRLDGIHVGHLIAYQRARVENANGLWNKKCGPSIINHELCVVQQVMKRAKEWSRIGDLYTALPIPISKKKKVLDDLEKRRLFSIAARRPEWELVLLVAKLSSNTTAAVTELRHLRLEDVILDPANPRIVIDGDTAKNSYRGRVIRLNETAQAAIERCLVRGKKLGAHLPEHYLFPFHVNRGLCDPSRPCSESWLKRSFNSLRKEAGLPWLTPHCFRHMAITAMLENGEAPETVRHIAGHVSEQMMRHYSHNRLEAQVGVLAALDRSPRSITKRASSARAQQRHFLSRSRRPRKPLKGLRAGRAA